MKNKLIASLISGLFLAGGALATTPSPPVSGAVPLGSGQQEAKPKLDVNPFTGKNLSVEQIQRELEETKLKTALLEETLKQTNLAEELKTLPVRKALETAQTRTAMRREEISVVEMDEKAKESASVRDAAERVRKAQVAAAEQAVKDAKAAKAAQDAAARGNKSRAKKSKPGSKPAKAAQADTQPQPEKQPVQKEVHKPLPTAVLTSVLDVGGSRSAMLEIDGNTLMVHEGGMTPLGPVRILDSSSVELNGTRLRVHSSTISRFVTSDAKVELQKGRPGGTAPNLAGAPPVNAAPNVGAAPEGNSSAAAKAAAAQKASATVALPPLQLPPGVAILPGSVK